MGKCTRYVIVGLTLTASDDRNPITISSLFMSPTVMRRTDGVQSIYQ